MRRLLVQYPCLCLLLSVSQLGCQSESGRLPYSRDPLLVAQKAVEGQFARELPQTVLNEPLPPRLPVEAYVVVPSEYRSRAPVPSALAFQEPPALKDPAEPGILPHSSRVPGILVARRKMDGAFGHAPDYSWLRGTLFEDTSGSLRLRYAESAGDDRWGGRVTLTADARLEQLRPGDRIMVEGEIVPPASGSNDPPTYQLREIWLLERARATEPEISRQ